jgi:hypothetical protein
MGFGPSFLLSASRMRLILALGLALLGCAPKIGDACETSTDCSQNADRQCDISQPGGYCTIFNCEPADSNPASKCPDESACVAFAAEPSPLPGCANSLGSTPYTETFCLKKCDNGDDCRSGYICVDPETVTNGAGDHYFSAVDLDGPSKVCVVAFSAPAPSKEEASSDVCSSSSNGAAGSDSGASGAGGVEGG